MGLRDAFRLTRAAAELSPVIGRPAARVGIRSPWSTTQLSTVVLADIFGVNGFPVTRAEAMAVPAVAKARHLICSPLARQPLVQYRGADRVSSQPSWLYRTDTPTHPNIRMLWTLDDLLFGGWSLWAVQRGAGDQITDAMRVPPELWTFGSDGLVEVSGGEVEAGSVILFSGPFEGLLEAAPNTIRAAAALERAWHGRARNPIPAIDLHQTDDEQLTPDEIGELLDAWATARNDPQGALAYTPNNIDARAMGTSESAMFVDARNALRVDVANLTGLPVALLDGSTATASLTYSTQEGRRSEFLDYSVVMWQDPVESRLSMDDACPRGTRIAFDLSNLTELPQLGQSPTRED